MNFTHIKLKGFLEDAYKQRAIGYFIYCIYVTYTVYTETML